MSWLFLLRGLCVPGMLKTMLRVLIWPPSRARYDRARVFAMSYYKRGAV